MAHRHPALQDLSRDHFTALLRSQHVRRALEGDPRAPAPAQAATAFLALWEGELELHFEEEDVDLHPLLEGVQGKPLRDRLGDDHATLRASFAEWQAAGGDADWPHLAVLADDLRRHVRWEEDELFPWLQEHLTEPQLEALRQRSRKFRLDKRGAQAVGPGGSCDVPD